MSHDTVHGWDGTKTSWIKKYFYLTNRYPSNKLSLSLITETYSVPQNTFRIFGEGSVKAEFEPWIAVARHLG
jgi:hypothetical protein